MEDKMEYTNPEYEEKQEKMSMADRFITAMLAPRDYGKLLKLSSGSVVGFFALVIFLVSFIQYAIPTLGAVAGLGGVRNIIENQIPQFSLENGTFTLDEKIEQQDNSMGVYIIVDTDKKKFTKDDIPANVVEAIMVSKSNMILYNEVAGVGKLVQEQKFSDYKDITINNKSLAETAPVFYVLMIVIYIGIYLFVLVKYLFMAVFYALVMYLLSKTMMLDITFGRMYKIAMFAQVFGALVMAVTYCIGSAVLVLTGSAFNMLVTVILMNKAMVAMKMEQDAL